MALLPRLTRWFALILVRLRGSASSRYRPELHYMRGPGPACARAAAASGQRVQRARQRDVESK